MQMIALRHGQRLSPSGMEASICTLLEAAYHVGNGTTETYHARKCLQGWKEQRPRNFGRARYVSEEVLLAF